MTKVEREVRYDVRTKIPEGTNHYNVLIINKNHEAERILQRLIEQVRPVSNLMGLTKGTIKGTGVRYRLVTFDSDGIAPTNINWGEIYQGKVTRSRDLYDRETTDGLANYVDNLMALESS